MNRLATQLFVLMVGGTAGTFIALLLVDMIIGRMASEIGAAGVGMAGALATFAALGK